MVKLDARIQNLVDYARNQDGADRTVLFQNMIDLFLAPDAPSRAPIRNQLLDVLQSLIPHVSPESRKAAAGLIGSTVKPPMDLVMRLVQDDPTLIGDLLRLVDFEEDDLIDLIQTTGRAHHQEIAARNNLSANVWIALARAAPNRSAEPGLSKKSLFEGELNPKAPAQEATITALHPERVGERFDLPATTPEPMPDAGTQQGAAARHALEMPELPSFLQDPKEGFLPDPAPGAWAFTSNRDGLVTQLSPMARSLVADSQYAVGDSLLDFFGLNQKLGHPVARAFQRRSPIHAAPLYIDSCPKGQRYWSLEAAPRFSSQTGAFDGYEGTLLPVTQETAPPPQPEPDSDMFTSSKAETVSSVRESGSVTSSSAYVDQLTRMESLSDGLLAQLEAAISDESFAVQDEQDELKPDASITSRPVPQPNTDETAVLDMPLKAQETHSNDKQDAVETQDHGSAAPDPEAYKTSSARETRRQEALEMLDGVVEQILQASKGDTAVNLRLQAEIAAACVRSLKDS